MNEKPVEILLVEDDAAQALLVRRALEDRLDDVRLQVVGSLKDARRCLQTSSPDLMIADFVLPDGRGIDLLSSEYTGSFPVLIMTSQGDERLAVEAMTQAYPPYDLDDALIAEATRTESFQVRVYCPEQILVVMGRGSRAELEVEIECCEADGVPVLRRRGGGRTNNDD